MTGAHPAIAVRLTEQMHGLANLVNAADTETFSVGTNVHGAAERLMESLETVMAAAMFQRPRT